MSDTNPKSSMTLPEILARLERMEQEARADAAYSGSLAWKFANDRTLAVMAGSDVAINAAHTALDALALSAAREALSAQEGLSAEVWKACEDAGLLMGSQGEADMALALMQKVIDSKLPSSPTEEPS